MHSRRYKKKGEKGFVDPDLLSRTNLDNGIERKGVSTMEYQVLYPRAAHEEACANSQNRECLIIAHPTGLRKYVFDFPVLFVGIQTNPPKCQFYWNAGELPKSERFIRNACELLKSEKFVEK